MSSTLLRIGIAGCGPAARVHVDRLLAIDGVRVVGCADTDLSAAEALATRLKSPRDGTACAFSDHKELIQRQTPDALAIFSPHPSHYRAAMDALQADCHVFIEKPLSTNPQEAVDITGLARGRGRKVGVGHHYRLSPGLIEARRLLAVGAIGSVRLITATLAQPWLFVHQDQEHAWHFDANVPGGGVMADSGCQLLDALLWTTGQPATEAAAFQNRLDAGTDLVTAAVIRLADGCVATVAISGVSPGFLYELNYLGETGRMRVTDRTLELETPTSPLSLCPLPESTESIDGNFVAAVVGGHPLCCPAEDALASVKLLEAITRSTATGQIVRLA